jgi:predicted dehydrogenase
MSLRVGVIGAGSIAQNCHIPGYAASDEAEVLALVDPVEERLVEAAKLAPAARHYQDYATMLDREELDVVSVCAPNKFHAPAAIAALRAGRHVLCEKPMAVSAAEAEEMKAEAERAGKHLMICFTHRFIAGPLRCKKVIEDGGIGKPFMIRVRFAHSGPFPGWAQDPATFYDPEIAAGGAMLDMGIHAIDLVSWLLGPIAKVSGKTATLIKDIPVDDNALMLLTLENGALGYIEVGWTSKPGFTGLEIYGTEGSLICDYTGTLRMVGGTASAGEDSSTNVQTLEEKPNAGGWKDQLTEWIDVVQGRKPLVVGPDAGISALKVALAAYESSRTGQETSAR